MITRLTRDERRNALILLGLVGLMGAVLGLAGRNDVLGWHGLLIVVFAAGLALPILGALDAPEPTEDRATAYYDDPTRLGILLSMAWAVFGLFIGVWVAALLAWPELTFVDLPWASFGRLRPAHTTGVIFGLAATR